MSYKFTTRDPLVYYAGIPSIKRSCNKRAFSALVLPYMFNFHKVYEDAPLGQKHALLRELFKEGFTYKNGLFRTPSVNPDLKCNSLLLNKIGLL